MNADKSARMAKTVIIGTGHYLPEVCKTNDHFLKNSFFDNKGKPYEYSNERIIQKFYEITKIKERRYIRPDQTNSDIATIAAERAIKDANIDPETLDYIICATNFGEVLYGDTRSDFMPSIAARVKNKLQLKNPKIVAYDMIFGCPGWVESMIQAEAFIKAGLAKKVLVIGTETLSRVVDENDRDSMIFADGAGAVVVEASSSDASGLLSHNTESHTLNEVDYLFNGTTYKPGASDKSLYIKMKGRNIYTFALKHVPEAIKKTIEDAGLDISDISKVLIHQANEKMDEAIITRLYRLYKQEAPAGAMPMTIGKFGNSSVATIPTMLDLIRKNQLGDHRFKKGDNIVFTSVGAGMHINAIVYRF